MKTYIFAISILVASIAAAWFIAQKPSDTLSANKIVPEIQQNSKIEALRQATIKIDGMWCTSCAAGAEWALKDKNGVVEAEVDYNSETGRIIYNPQKISQGELIKAVEPYKANIIEDKSLE